MDDSLDIPEESMRHIDALLARHPPQAIMRMFQQAMDSRRSSNASSFTSSTTSSSTNSSLRSRLSIASTFSTSTASSDAAPSIASSSSSRSRMRRPEPRSFPTGLDPTRPVPSMLTPASEMSSPRETKPEPSFTPTEEDMSISSPIVLSGEKGHGQSGESSYMFCTYCAEQRTLKTFKAKSDWKKHEMRMHETGEDWPCIVNSCNRIFDRQKDFLKHHQRYHSGRPLPSLTDIGITLLPRRVFGCGFDKCKEVSIGWDERCDHVAKHMKNGASFQQWKYSNVIRNLIRQEALHDTWKDLVGCLDERLRESRSHISWCPDNTRILRQKLQCCDLRPSREEVLITALSLRSDFCVDAIHQQLPPGFITPSRDSVPNVDKLSREQRMNILIGNPNSSTFRSRLAAINTALLQAVNASPIGNFDSGTSPFEEAPAVDASGRRISYMDVDTAGEFPNMTQSAMTDMPPPNMEAHLVIDGDQPDNAGFVDPSKTDNPLGLCYPSYFDAAPQFEESQYYERPSIGQMISKPLHKIGSRLSRHSSSQSGGRASSQLSQHGGDMGADFPIQSPMGGGVPMRQQQQQQQHQPPPPPPPHHHQMPPPQYHYRTAESQHHHQSPHQSQNQLQDQLHLFTTQN